MQSSDQLNCPFRVVKIEFIDRIDKDKAFLESSRNFLQYIRQLESCSW